MLGTNSPFNKSITKIKIMKNPYNPIPYTLASIFASGIGFLFLGIWVGINASHDERVLLGFGITFIVISVGFAIVSSIKSRLQSSYDTGSIPPNSKL